MSRSSRLTLADLPTKYQNQVAAILNGSRQLGPASTTSKALPVAPKPRLRQREGTGANKLETAFLDYLNGQHITGNIRYNAVSFELANGLRYKPDVTVNMKVAYEVKGPWASRDAFPRLKMAARLYPELDWYLATKAKGGGWDIQKILP